MRLFNIISIIWLAILLSVSYYLNENIEFNNKKWLKDNHPLNKIEKNIEKTFDIADSFAMSFYSNSGIWQEEKIQLIRKIEEELSPLFRSINSPAQSKTALLDNDTIHFYKYAKGFDKNILSNYNKWQNHIVQSPYIGQILSRDNTLWQSVLTPKKNIDNQYVITQINTTLNSYQNQLKKLNISAYLIGSPTAYTITNNRSETDIEAITILAVLILFIAIFLFTQNISFSIWILLTMWTNSLIPIIIIHSLGYQLNSLHLVLPVLIMTITLADALHIYFHRFDCDDHKQTIKHMALPCFLTSFTTLGGTVIFYGDILLPLHTIATTGTLSILFAYVIIMLSTYVYLKKFMKISNLKSSFSLKLLPLKYYKIFIVSLCSIGFVGLSQIQSNSSFLDIFFKPEDIFYKNVVKTNNHIDGVQKINVLISESGTESFKNYDNFAKVLKLKQDLLKIDKVKSVKGYYDATNIIHKSFNGEGKYPSNESALSQEIFFAELSRSENEKGILESWTSFDYNKTRLEILIPLLKNQELNKTMTQIETTIKSSGFNNINWSGTTALFYEIGKLIIPSHIKGIIGTIIITFLSLLFIYGFNISFRATLIGATPFIAMIGVMSIFRINLDYSTVILVSIGMGLAVDDCIHTANYIKNKKQKTPADFKSSIGRVILITGFTLSLGYIMFILSDIAMLNKFGYIMPLTQIVASLFTVSAGIWWIDKINNKT